MDQKITPKIKMLVIRISAMGDVALTVPPLNRIIKNNPELEITFISKPPYGCFFWGIPRFKFYPVQFNNYRGILGLQKLSNEIFYSEKFDLVIDLHGSLRSRIMCWFAQWRGIPSFRINKGRSEKKLATRKTGKILKPLKSIVNRYLEVFAKAGLNTGNFMFQDEAPREMGLEIKEWEGIQINPSTPKCINLNDKNIGWAPFAGFQLKEMPIQKQISLVNELLSQIFDLKIIFFAGRDQEMSLKPFFDGIPHCFHHRMVFSGNLTQNLEDELVLISSLNIMVSMDSANMHLAALLGVNVLGIYGTTHPDLGYVPYLQRESGTYGINGLYCRPCTVFGNGTCYRGDFACMQKIIINDLVENILFRLKKF